MKKKVIIDAVVLLSPFAGIARYTYENSKLIKESQKYNLYFNYIYPSQKLLENRETKKKTKKFRNFLIKNKYLKKYSRKILNSISSLFPKVYDIYWQPNIIPNPHVKAKKIVSTVHDLSFLHYPESHPKERINYFNKKFKKEVSKCSHIITGSHYTKNEIMNYLHFDEKKITVIYHGINHKQYKVYPDIELEDVKRKFNLPNKFLLFAGSIEPRKNLQTLLKAFNALGEDIKKQFPLVLIGGEGWKNKNILDEINNSKYIRYLGYIKDEDLPYMYNLATIFIYPSLYEGFGIPPIEAFACGTPVIVSDTTSMPEVCGDAALYIDPLNQADIKDKILLLSNDKNLQEKFILKGLERSKEFTWQRAASQHIEVFDNLI